MSRHLVIGASGQVGEHLLQHLVETGKDSSGTYYKHPRPGMHWLDIREDKTVAELIKVIRPTVVYLPASLTNVDYCECHPDAGYESNVIGTRNVLRATNAAGALLVYFSSDYIFDGANGPYAEGDVARPLSAYGRQKLLSEHYIALHAGRYLIVRTTVVYGWESQAKNFVQRLIERLQRGEVVSVPVDQFGSPTYAPNLVAAVVELVDKGFEGLFHVVGPRVISRYDFAVAAAQAFGQDPSLIEATTTEALGQAAPRPLKAGLDPGKAQSILSTKLLDYSEGLRAMANELPRRDIGEP